MKRLLVFLVSILALTATVKAQNTLAGSITLSNTGGAGFVQIANQSSAPATPTSAGRLYFDSANFLAWKNSGGFIGKVDLGGANRTLTFSGSPTLGDWFDQSVKTTASPTFVNVTASLTGNASTATALANGRTISITGDLAYTSPSFDGTGNVTAAGTLSTVNSNVGSFGSSTAIPSFTVNGKGLVTAASTNAVVAPAGTLTGATLASNVLASSLTSLGTIASFTATTSSLGTATATSVNKVAITAPATSATLTIANGKTLTASNTLTFTGTDSSSVAFGAGGTVLYSGGSYVASLAGTANEITASASTGAVTLSLPSALTFTGKTVTGGAFASGAFNGTVGATTPATGAFTSLSASGNITATNGIVIVPSATDFIVANQGSDNQRFRINGTDRAVVSSTGLAVTGTGSFTGNTWVGALVDATSGSADGVTAYSDGQIHISRNGLASFIMRRRTSDGSAALFYRDTTNVGSISVTTTATAYNTSSDRRLKTRIRDFTDSGAIIDQFRPRIFDWKTGEKDSIGFIAQELRDIPSSGVTVGDDDPDTITKQWQVDYSKPMPVVIAELQSLRRRVAVLEAANTATWRGYIAIPIALIALVVALRRRK